MAAVTIWFVEIPITSVNQPSQGFILLETGDRIILEDGSGFLQLEGLLSNPIRDVDKSQLLIGCSLVFGQSVSMDYYRRYLNDKGVVS